MRSRLRRLFICLSLLGYAFLGGGPSLWALGLNSEPCAMACSCRMAHGGPSCPVCAAMARRLARLNHAAPSHSCEMRQTPLAPQESADVQRDLPSQQPHTLPAALAGLSLAESRHLPAPGARGLSHYPEPPTPIPD
jgi:hypothetical protein